MTNQLDDKVKKLIQKGVKIRNPATVEIGSGVDVERISGQGVVIHSGCRILGSSTLIMRDVKIGNQGSATIENCHVGPEVSLHGGYFKDSVFLKKSNLQSGAHVREGTILEEEANGAHTVGLKQTILFPFVTLGSLINFCDCMMTGGTSRKNHSEVGSSFIHFNYTPNQDKATPSILGDVPRGVMLDQKPIFLGGQGGMVGPCRVEYGTVTAAGTILRKDILIPDQLVFGETIKGGTIPVIRSHYSNLQKIFKNNTHYIANLISLRQWYIHVRSMAISEDFPRPLFEGALQTIDRVLEERIRRLRLFCDALSDNDKPAPGNGSLGQQRHELFHRRFEVEDTLNSMWVCEGKQDLLDRFLEMVSKKISRLGTDYIPLIHQLKREHKEIGTGWLQSIIADTRAAIGKIVPTMIKVKNME